MRILKRLQVLQVPHVALPHQVRLPGASPKPRCHVVWLPHAAKRQVHEVHNCTAQDRQDRSRPLLPPHACGPAQGLVRHCSRPCHQRPAGAHPAALLLCAPAGGCCLNSKPVCTFPLPASPGQRDCPTEGSAFCCYVRSGSRRLDHIWCAEMNLLQVAGCSALAHSRRAPWCMCSRQAP